MLNIFTIKNKQTNKQNIWDTWYEQHMPSTSPLIVEVMGFGSEARSQDQEVSTQQ